MLIRVLYKLLTELRMTKLFFTETKHKELTVEALLISFCENTVHLYVESIFYFIVSIELLSCLVLSVAAII